MGVCFYSILRRKINATWSNYDFAALKLTDVTHSHVFDSHTYRVRLDFHDHFTKCDSVPWNQMHINNTKFLYFILCNALRISRFLFVPFDIRSYICISIYQLSLSIISSMVFQRSTATIIFA